MLHSLKQQLVWSTALNKDKESNESPNSDSTLDEASMILFYIALTYVFSSSYFMVLSDVMPLVAPFAWKEQEIYHDMCSLLHIFIEQGCLVLQEGASERVKKQTVPDTKMEKKEESSPSESDRDEGDVSPKFVVYIPLKDDIMVSFTCVLNEVC